MQSNPIRVLVVDDSAFMRKMITNMLALDRDICVVGQARDGAEAIEKLEDLHPDVITLDVEMPVLDGIAALGKIMQTRPTPVVMLSSITGTGADATIKCLELGAVDVVCKPSGSISLDIDKIGAELVEKVKAASKARVFNRKASAAVVPDRPVKQRTSSEKPAVLVIGSSTGGPKALQQLVPMLTTAMRLPIVIIQHMPPGFTASLATRLKQTSNFEAHEAIDGDRLHPGVILVAQGGHHLTFSSGGVAQLSDEPAVHGVRPSVDVTLMSLCKLYGPRMIAVLLTGMGRDGALGMKKVRDSGGTTIAEDESTCVVFGMPKAAYDLGGVDMMLPLPSIASAIERASR